jgi:exodeoxyribonuclease V gamma subunit
VAAADLLQAWLQHLALCLARPPGVALCTRWLAAESSFSFKPVDDAAALLDALVALYRQGLCEPLHFFPKSAWVWVNSGGSHAAVARTWRVTQQIPWAEGSNAYFRLALRGQAEPLDSRFQALAEAVFEPLRDHLDAPG